LLSLAFLYCYWNVLTFIASQWVTNDVYSYGPLIPVISGWLVWQRRERLAAVGWRGAPAAGLLALTAGLMLLLLGRRVGIASVEAVSLPISLAAVILVLGGSGMLRVLWFPVAYLFAMLPVWDVFTEPLHYPLQQMTAAASAPLLRLGGVPVHREDTYLQLPNITLEVARICSGVNYMLAVAAIGVPLGALMFADRRRRMLLVVFGLAVAVLANPVRVALIGIFSYYQLSDVLHGPGHAFQGLFVAVVGYLALFAGARLLALWPAPSRAAAQIPRRDALARARTPARRVRLAAAAAAVVLLAVGSLPPAVVRARAERAPIALPERLGSWRRAELPALARTNPETTSASVSYVDASGRRAEVYVGGVMSDSPGDADLRVASIVDLGGSPLRLDLGGGRAVTVSLAVRGAGLDRTLLLYWYDAMGGVHPYRTLAKLGTLWHRASGLGREPSVVIVSSPLHAASEDAALAQVAGLARELVFFLRRSSRPVLLR
ncbi:MAG TPA: exosortase/archaeosortase family protein, partial [Vicinamibacterales bacterium]|nr:exosortase/archaeosortase family protein [Vicinamibacterales bacterium]